MSTIRATRSGAPGRTSSRSRSSRAPRAETGPVGSVPAYAYYPETSPGGGTSPFAGRELDPSTGGYLKRMAAPLSWANYAYDSRGNLTGSADSQGANRGWNVDR